MEDRQSSVFPNQIIYLNRILDNEMLKNKSFKFRFNRHGRKNDFKKMSGYYTISMAYKKAKSY